MTQFSTKPPRGTADRYGEELAIRQYIFDIWRRVCRSFGYEEYLCPLVEKTDLYRAKSGEDVGGSELTQLTDREGNISDLALRPEMTPSVTRMVAGMYPQMSKPVRLFSIANFYRNERPQRGRNREFRQLNIDMFGGEGQWADLEMLQLALEIMLAFDVPDDSFVLYLNHRVLIDDFLLEECLIDSQLKQGVTRTMDKWDKLSREDFVTTLVDQGLDQTQVDKIVSLLEADTLDTILGCFDSLESSEGLAQLRELMVALERLGYGHVIQFQPSLMRGFDYYDGLIFEVFDRHPDNRRAMFGGGRYNGLAELFGQKFPAIGMAPGDEPMRLFLESWDLIEDRKSKIKKEIYFIPVLAEGLYNDCVLLAKQLRADGKQVELDIKVRKLGKAMQYADKKGCTHVVIMGEQEINEGKVKIKELSSGEEDFIQWELKDSNRINPFSFAITNM